MLWANIAFALLIFLCNLVSDVRQDRLNDISMQCKEPLGQQCTGFLPIQCCPKSIKTTLNNITKLNRIFSYTMLSGASRSTQHKVFPVQCCPGDNIAQIKPCAVLYEREAPNNISQEKIPCNFVLIPLRQHYTRNSPMQCCP